MKAQNPDSPKQSPGGGRGLMPHTASPRMTSLHQRPVVYVPPAAKALNRRSCKCTKCRTCVDNARWERIFRQKFADPDYYTQPRRSGSSLSSCI